MAQQLMSGVMVITLDHYRAEPALTSCPVYVWQIGKAKSVIDCVLSDNNAAFVSVPKSLDSLSACLIRKLMVMV